MRILLSFIVLLWAAGLSGQRLHFILVAPDETVYEPSFATGLEQRVRNLGNAAGMEVEWRDYSRTVSADRLRRELSTLASGPDDVLWLYYYGPAEYDNEDLLEDFPYFELKGERVFLSKLHNLLKSRPHRLALSFLDGANARTGVVATHQAAHRPDDDRLRQLLQARGDLVVTGYARYQDANYHPRFGGLFTHAFFQALEYVSSRSCTYDPIWAEVLYHADTFMKQMLNGLEKEQKLYYRMDVVGHEFSEAPPPHGPQFSGEGGASYQYYIPSFPWPPPAASASYNLPRDLLAGQNDLAGVDALLRKAIDRCGYAERSYYAAPGGFALVTRVEQFDPGDASSLDPPARWSAEIGGMEDFSVVNYLKSLFFGEKGSFRVFVFLVSSVPFSQSANAVSREQTEEWLSKGLNRLPGELGQQPLTSEHNCTVLVFEFEQNESGEARFIERSRFPSQVHLEQSNILNNLKRRP